MEHTHTWSKSVVAKKRGGKSFSDPPSILGFWDRGRPFPIPPVPPHLTFALFPAKNRVGEEPREKVLGGQESPTFHSEKKYKKMEMPGIEPGAFHMQSERATTALHPRHTNRCLICPSHLGDSHTFADMSRGGDKDSRKKGWGLPNETHALKGAREKGRTERRIEELEVICLVTHSGRCK